MKTNINNIIIKTPSFIGDTIMMLPALELLKLEYPKASFTVVCKTSQKDLFRGKNISKIIIDDTKVKSKSKRVKKVFSLISDIKTTHYDLGILFHNTFLDALIFKLSNIDTIIGYDKENRKILLDFWLKIDRTRHYINHYANLVNQFLDNKYTKLPPMELEYEPSKLLVKKNKKLIGLMLGGESKDTRGYPTNLSLEFLNLTKDDDYCYILLGDKNDNQHNDIIENELIKNNIEVVNLSNKTTIAELIDVIALLDVLITIDSSALHISAGVGTKYIALIGKGSSAFDTVQPKVDFGTIIFQAKDYIKDEDLIKQIEPISIYNALKLSLN